MIHNDSHALFTFANLETIGGSRIRKLLSLFSSPDDLFRATAADLMDRGVSDQWARAFTNERDRVDVSRLRDRCETLGIRFLVASDQAFPLLLKEIPDPPIGLFVRGDLGKEALTIAVVGTRAATGYGRQVTRELVGALARAGVVVVSGLALGIDGVAHEAAIAAGGKTIAVLPCGLDRVYPASHDGLAQRIVENGGALVSEFGLGTLPLKYHFPIRNRIIAGMASGTLVTEAPERSGALLTAFLALEYNRDVFAVPGPITAPSSCGTHRLLRSGAQLVERAEDILSAYHMASETQAKSEESLSDRERLVLSYCTREPRTVDQIQNLSRLNTSVINATLVCLQMKGWIVQHDPMHVVRNR